jgi:hypothetical protein
MRYAVIQSTTAGSGYIIKRALFARRNRVFLGSYAECVAWIAGYKCALIHRPHARIGAVPLTLLPPGGFQEAS